MIRTADLVLPAKDVGSLRFELDGAQHFAGAVTQADLDRLERVFATLPGEQAGLRLHGIEALYPLLAPTGSIGRIAASVLSTACLPVRALLFDKTATTNWSLPWHQDRTIVVAARREVEGFGPWTVKDGLIHVAPPIELLASMVTLRAHLDIVPISNAPLLIAPGSHRFGRVAEPDIPDVVARCGVATCLAQRGDIWLYATPILHASEVASQPRCRRVLQVDFALGGLPGGLKWLGI
ncbi:phytanoyl-CoA dioxygenase family protein [Labrys neptuniae]